MEYYSAIKKEQNNIICSNMDELEILTLSELSQKEKGKNHMIYLHVESKIWHKWTYLQNRNKLMDI